MYPIAWGVSQSEKSEVCKWFIALLQSDLEIEDDTGWNLISC